MLIEIDCLRTRNVLETVRLVATGGLSPSSFAFWLRAMGGDVLRQAHDDARRAHESPAQGLVVVQEPPEEALRQDAPGRPADFPIPGGRGETLADALEHPNARRLQRCFLSLRFKLYPLGLRGTGSALISSPRVEAAGHESSKLSLGEQRRNGALFDREFPSAAINCSLTDSWKFPTY